MTFSQHLKKSYLDTKIFEIHAWAQIWVCTESSFTIITIKRFQLFTVYMDFQNFCFLVTSFQVLRKSHFMTFFKKCLRLSQIHDLCISRWKNLIFSKGQRRKIDFLIFLPSTIILEAIKKKLETSSFPKYFHANLPDVDCKQGKIATLGKILRFL